MSADTHRTYEEQGNTNPMPYIIRDYCKKYPNDQGDQNINEEDVARPTNHKWAKDRLKAEEKRKTVVGFPTYGTRSICWNSGLAYKKCIKCGVWLNTKPCTSETTFSILKRLPNYWVIITKLQKQTACSTGSILKR